MDQVLPAGRELRKLVFRFDDLSSLPLQLGGSIDAPYRIVAVENPSAEQQRTYQSWLGVALTK